jgi:hypothetical protein
MKGQYLKSTGQAVVHNPLVQTGAVLLFYAGITVLMTWPLALDLKHSIIGQTGDNLYYVWLVGWYHKAIFELGINPLVVPFHNSPAGWPLAYSELTLSNALPGVPFSVIGGPVLGYNAVLLLSFVFSGWLVYEWSHRLTGNRWASLLAGTIFSFAPYRLAHAYGHLPLMGTHWLVMHYFGLFLLLREYQFRWRYALLAGIGAGLAALSSMYYLYMTVIVSAFFVAVFLLLQSWQEAVRGKFWLKLVPAVGTALPWVLIAVLPYFQLAQKNEANHRPLIQVDLFSASISDFFLPAPIHYFWGSWISKIVQRPLWVEQYIYLGLVPLLLVLFGFVLVWKGRDSHLKRVMIWLALPAVLAAILALGTTLHWMGDPVVYQPVPGFLQQFDLTAQGNIPMPNYLLFRFLPFYNAMRVWARYGVYVMLFVSLLAGIGFASLRARMSSQRALAALFLFLLALFLVDVRIPTPTTRVAPRAVDLWLAEQPDQGAVVELPIEDSSSPACVYGSYIHDKPLFGMFYGAYFPAQYEQDIQRFGDFPSEDGISLLRDRGVHYVLINLEKMPGWAQQQDNAEQLGLRLAAAIDPYWVYVLESAE